MRWVPKMKRQSQKEKGKPGKKKAKVLPEGITWKWGRMQETGQLVAHNA